MDSIGYFFMAWTDPQLLFIVAAGTFAGIYIGAIPGLSVTMAASILISDLAGHVMNPPADVLLAAPRGRTQNEFQTPIVPFALVNAILLTMAARHEAQTIGALERLAALVADFEED